MPGESNHNYAAARALASRSNQRWEELCASYLPVMPEKSIWRYSRAVNPCDPRQGWKLHLSATVLTAVEVFEKVASFLQSRKTLFKAPVSLGELRRINCGLFYGYSQVGKFMTVYPQSDGEAVSLARRLHRLTHGMPAPSVPFDLRFRLDSCVYYRYGSFEPLEMVYPDGLRMAAMRDLEGNLIPDLRYSQTGMPEWVKDPFVRPQIQDFVMTESPLNLTYRGFAALAQRGKGGVYKAIDSMQRPRFCILKEGRRDGEVDWDGRDGHWRVKHEVHVLTCLRAEGVPVPKVYDSFGVENNYYLVTECIGGESLHAALLRRRKRFSISQALRYSLELAFLIDRIHEAGWAWRDCKPSNIMVTRGGLRPLDFEGACPVNQPDPVPWGTPAFVPPEWQMEGIGRSGIQDDLYALGVVMYLLFGGKVPDEPTAKPLKRLRRGIPAPVLNMVSKLLSPDPRRRPGMEVVVQRLERLSKRRNA